MNLIPGLLYTAVLFGGVSINKYVLSVLGFRYPTIFQGWQTVVGTLLYKGINICNRPSFPLTPLDKAAFVSFLPGLLFYTTALVANSKALAEVPVPVFICVHNCLPAVVYMLDRILPSSRPPTTSLHAMAALLVITTGCFLLLTDVRLNFQESAHFWLAVGVVCSGAATLHARIVDARYTAWDRLFYSSLFSVILLAPASLYLEEAFHALNFRHDRQGLFLAGCLASAIFVCAANLYTVRLKQDEYFGPLHHAASGFTVFVSTLMFSADLAWWQWLLVVLNVVATIPLPSHLAKDEEESSYPGIIQGHTSAHIVQRA